MQFDRNTLRCLFLDLVSQLTDLATRAAANDPDLDNQFAVLLESLNQTVAGLFDVPRVETLPPDLAEQSLDLLQRYKLLRDHCRGLEAQLAAFSSMLRLCGLPADDASFFSSTAYLDVERLPFSIAEHVIATCDSEALRRLLGGRATEVANEDVLRGLDDLHAASERLKEREAQFQRRESLLALPTVLQSSKCGPLFADSQASAAEAYGPSRTFVEEQAEGEQKDCLVLLAGKDLGSKAKAKKAKVFSNDLADYHGIYSSGDGKTERDPEYPKAQPKSALWREELAAKDACAAEKKFYSEFTYLNSAMQEELTQNRLLDKGTSTGDEQIPTSLPYSSALLLSVQRSAGQEAQKESANEKQAFDYQKALDAVNSEARKLQEQVCKLQTAVNATNERADKETASRRLIESYFDAYKQLCDIARARASELQAALDRARDDAEKREYESSAALANLKREADEAAGNVARLQQLLENALQEHREAAKTISGLYSELKVSRQRMLEFETYIDELRRYKLEAVEEARQNCLQAEKLYELKQNNERAERELLMLRQEVVENKEEIKRLRDELNARQAHQADLEQEVAYLDRLTQKAADAENLALMNKELRAEIDAAAVSAREMASAVESALADAEKSKLQENTAGIELAALRQRFAELERGAASQKQLATCQAQRADRLAYELENAQAALYDYQRGRALAEGKQDQLVAEMQALREQAQQEKQRAHALTRYMKALEAAHAKEREQLKAECDSARGKLSAAEYRLSNSLAECDEFRTAVQTLEARTAEITRENEALKAQQHEMAEQCTELALLRQETQALYQQLEGAQQESLELAELRQALARSSELTENQAAELRRMQQTKEARAEELERTRNECAERLEQMQKELEQARSTAVSLQDEAARSAYKMCEIEATARHERESLSDAVKQNSTLEYLVYSLQTEKYQLKDSADKEKADLLQQSVQFYELAENEGKRAAYAEELAQQIIEENGKLQEDKAKLDDEMEYLRESRSELEKERYSLLSELQLSKSAARSLEESYLQADELERLSLYKDREISQLRDELLSYKAEHGRSSAEIESMREKRSEMESMLAYVSYEADSLRKQAEYAEKNSEVLRMELAELRKSWPDKRVADKKQKATDRRQSAAETQQQGPSQRKPQIRPVFLDINGKKREMSVQDDCQFFTLKNILMSKENKRDGYYSFVHGDQELQNDYLVKDVQTADADPIKCRFERFQLNGGDIPIKVVYLNYRQKQAEVYYITAGTTALEFVQFLARVENFSEIKSISADQYFELVITKNIQDNVDEKYDLDWPILEFPGYKQSGVLRMKTDCLCQDAAEWREDYQGRIVRVIPQ